MEGIPEVRQQEAEIRCDVESLLVLEISLLNTTCG